MPLPSVVAIARRPPVGAIAAVTAPPRLQAWVVVWPPLTSVVPFQTWQVTRKVLAKIEDGALAPEEANTVTVGVADDDDGSGGGDGGGGGGGARSTYCSYC